MPCEDCRVPVTLRDTFWSDPFFASHYSDFERMREEMLQHSRDIWRHFNRGLETATTTKSVETFKTSDTKLTKPSSTDIERTKSDDDNNSEEDRWLTIPFPRMRQFMRMFDGKDLMRTSDTSFTDLWGGRATDDQTIKISDSDKAFELSLDTHNYRPDEIKVTVSNTSRDLKIEGKHEEKSVNEGRFVSRQFVRQYTLPKGCKPEKVISNLSSDGVLMITAPKEPPASTNSIPSDERNIPIEMKE